MTPRVACPKCQKSYVVTEQLAGKQMRCLACAQLFQFPPLAGTQPAAPAPVAPSSPAVSAWKPVTPPTPPAIPPARLSKPAAPPRVQLPRPADDAPRRPVRKPAAARGSFPLVLTLLIAGAVLLVLGGGGAVALFLFLSPAQEVTPEVVAQQEPEKKAKEKVPDKKVKEKVPDDKVKEKVPDIKPKEWDEKPKDKVDPVQKEAAGEPFNIPDARRSVVFLKVLSDGVPVAGGSGFLVSKDGLVYTNRHVLMPDEDLPGYLLLVGVPSEKDPDVLDYFKAETVYTAPKRDKLDFAVVKIAARPDHPGFRPLPLAKAKLKLGEAVAALGYPSGLKFDVPTLSLNKGAISATLVRFDQRAYHQTDAAINPGNSGGPLLNQSGEAVGIVTLKKADAQNMGYALYLSEVQAVALDKERLAAVQPEPGPYDLGKLPKVATVTSNPDAYQVIKGKLKDEEGFLTLDNNGGRHWMVAKESLPEHFKLTLEVGARFLQGNQTIYQSQRGMLRTLVVRLSAPNLNDLDILDSQGSYHIKYTDTMLHLSKEGEIVKSEKGGTPNRPFLMTVTRLNGTITVTANGDQVLRYTDSQPLSGRTQLTIGGYLSKVYLGKVTVTPLKGDPVVVVKNDPKKNPVDIPPKKDPADNPPKKEKVDPPVGGDDLRGPPQQLQGLTVTPLKLPAKNLAPTLCWGDQAGSILFTADDQGIVRRVLVPSFKETHKLDLERKCTNLVLSSAGLLAALGDVQEVWVLDVGSLRVLKKISVPGLREVAASPKVPFAVASLENGLTVVDLQSGKTEKVIVRDGGRPGFANPVMTPDGRYVFTRGGIEQLSRFSVKGDTLEFDESSPRIQQGVARAGVQLSLDSKYVCLPCYPGNYNVGGTHPKLTNGGIYIYPTDNLQMPVFAIQAGSGVQVVAFDPVSRKVYSQNGGASLIVFGPAGIKQQEYKLPFGGGRDVRQYLVHPEGNRLLVLSSTQLVWVELPAAKRE